MRPDNERDDDYYRRHRRYYDRDDARRDSRHDPYRRDPRDDRRDHRRDDHWPDERYGGHEHGRRGEFRREEDDQRYHPDDRFPYRRQESRASSGDRAKIDLGKSDSRWVVAGRKPPEAHTSVPGIDEVRATKPISKKQERARKFFAQNPEIRVPQRLPPPSVRSVADASSMATKRLGDDLNMIIQHRVESDAREAVLGLDAKANLFVCLSRRQVSDSEVAQEKLDPAKLDSLFTMVKHDAKHDITLTALHPLLRELNGQNELTDAVKEYLKAEVRVIILASPVFFALFPCHNACLYVRYADADQTA